MLKIVTELAVAIQSNVNRTGWLNCV